MSQGKPTGDAMEEDNQGIVAQRGYRLILCEREFHSTGGTAKVTHMVSFIDIKMMKAEEAKEKK